MNPRPQRSRPLSACSVTVCFVGALLVCLADPDFVVASAGQRALRLALVTSSLVGVRTHAPCCLAGNCIGAFLICLADPDFKTSTASLCAQRLFATTFCLLVVFA